MEYGVGRVRLQPSRHANRRRNLQMVLQAILTLDGAADEGGSGCTEKQVWRFLRATSQPSRVPPVNAVRVALETACEAGLLDEQEGRYHLLLHVASSGRPQSVVDLPKQTRPARQCSSHTRSVRSLRARRCGPRELAPTSERSPTPFPGSTRAPPSPPPPPPSAAALTALLPSTRSHRSADSTTVANSVLENARIDLQKLLWGKAISSLNDDDDSDDDMSKDLSDDGVDRALTAKHHLEGTVYDKKKETLASDTTNAEKVKLKVRFNEKPECKENETDQNKVKLQDKGKQGIKIMHKTNHSKDKNTESKNSPSKLSSSVKRNRSNISIRKSSGSKDKNRKPKSKRLRLNAATSNSSLTSTSSSSIFSATGSRGQRRRRRTRGQKRTTLANSSAVSETQKNPCRGDEDRRAPTTKLGDTECEDSDSSTNSGVSEHEKGKTSNIRKKKRNKKRGDQDSEECMDKLDLHFLGGSDKGGSSKPDPPNKEKSNKDSNNCSSPIKFNQAQLVTSSPHSTQRTSDQTTDNTSGPLPPNGNPDHPPPQDSTGTQPPPQPPPSSTALETGTTAGGGSRGSSEFWQPSYANLFSTPMEINNQEPCFDVWPPRLVQVSTSEPPEAQTNTETTNPVPNPPQPEAPKEELPSKRDASVVEVSPPNASQSSPPDGGTERPDATDKEKHP